MSETRSVSKIEVRAETRGIKEVGKELDKAFDPARLDQFDATVQRFSDDVSGLTSELSALAKELAKVAAAMGSAGGGGGARGGGGAAGAAVGGAVGGAVGAAAGQARGSNGRLGGDTPTSRWGRARAGMGAGARRFGGYAQGVGQSAASGQFVETALNGIPIVGGVLAGAMGSARGYVRQADALSSSQMGAWGSQGRSGRGLRGFGVNHGLDPNALVGEMSNIGESTGLRGEELSDDIVKGLISHSRIMGVQGGGLLGANLSAGGFGTENPMEQVSEAIGTAIQSGFRDGKINQYLQEITSFTESARRDGISLTTETANAMTRGMSSLGLQGEAASNAALHGASAMRSSGRDNSLISNVNMGILMGEQGLTYMEALRELEQNPDAVMAAATDRLTSMAGGSNEALAQVLDMTGLSTSASSAITMAEGLNRSGGGGFGVSSYDAGSEQVANDRLVERAEGYQGISGGAVHQAGLVSRQIRTGQNSDVAGVVHDVEDMELSVTRALVGGIGSIVSEAQAALASGGIGAMFTHFGNKIMTFMEPMLTGLLEKIKEILPPWLGGTGTPPNTSGNTSTTGTPNGVGAGAWGRGVTPVAPLASLGAGTGAGGSRFDAGTLLIEAGRQLQWDHATPNGNATAVI